VANQAADQVTLFGVPQAEDGVKGGSPLREKAGVEAVDSLYLQLLYRCNFRCKHCFHGDALNRRDAFGVDDATSLIDLFVDDFNTRRVVLLGGEPLLHPGFADVVRHAHGRACWTEVCTNGYQIDRKLPPVAGHLDMLRVSLEGLPDTNDEVRHRGAFAAGTQAIETAVALGIRTGVTLTVNALNVDEIAELTRRLAALGVVELKLHQLRKVGYASSYWDLLGPGPGVGARLQRQLEACRADSPSVQVMVDDDLTARDHGPNVEDRSHLDRIEVAPDGSMYISCKAVGTAANAFSYDAPSRSIRYRPHETDEVACTIRDVHYKANP